MKRLVKQKEDEKEEMEKAYNNKKLPG